MNCAHCAEQINDKINKLEAIESAHLNFISKTLRIKFNSLYQEEDILNEVINIINSTEPGLDIKVLEAKSNKTKQLELILNDLNCSHWAEEINSKVIKLNGVKDSNLNFINKVLTIHIDNSIKKHELLDKVIELINDTEPGLDIKVRNKQKELSEKDNYTDIKDEEKLKKKDLLKFSFGASVYTLGILESTVNFNSNIINIVYLLAYLIVGGYVLYKAYKNALNSRVFDENFLMSVATIGAIVIG